MQVIENWTEIIGEVIYVEEDKENKSKSWITLKIIKKKPFQQFPDLLASLDRELFKVRMDQSTIDRLSILKGVTIHGTIRVANMDRYFLNQETLKIV